MLADEGVLQSFFFRVASEAGKEFEAVLELVRDSGDFEMCVTSKTQTPEKWEDCEIFDEDHDGNIIISDLTTGLTHNGVYGVMVKPIMLPESRGKAVSFQLSMSSQESYYDLELGTTFAMTNLSMAKLFSVKISQKSSSLAILLNSDDAESQLVLSPHKSDLYAQEPSEDRQIVTGSVTGILLKHSQISKICSEQGLEVAPELT